MDYKKLLTKYIAHVGNEEGIVFIDRIAPNCSKGGRLGIFNEDELAELKEIEVFTDKYLRGL